MSANRDAARQRLAALVDRYHAASGRSVAEPGLAARIAALAAFQAERLAGTYEDLRRSGRYRAAIEFFLEDLYGPQDLTARDEQVLKALDRLQRFLPAAALDALAGAFELHVLTLELDADTAAVLPRPAVPDLAAYAAAYRRAGRQRERVRQIELIGEIGALLDSIAHHPEIGLAVRLARGPAHAAGYGALQDFLERGYNAFRAMKGAGDFLAIIDRRERELMHRMLEGDIPVFLSPQDSTAREKGE